MKMRILIGVGIAVLVIIIVGTSLLPFSLPPTHATATPVTAAH